MQYKPTRSLCATVAIAATLALGPTSFAQDVAPTIALPPSAPAAVPTVALPPVTVQPTAPQPTAVAAPEPAARPAPRAQAPKAAAAPKQAVRAPAAAAPVAAIPAPVASPAPAEVLPPVAVEPAPAPVAATPAPAPAPAADTGLSGEEAGFIALLAALGLGGVAFAVSGLRRRRRRAEDVEVHDYAADPVPAVAPTVSLAPPVARAASGVSAQPVMAQPSPVVSPPETLKPAPVAVPADVPTGEDRQALLDRMVAAEPDEANPFTSAKARRRRARIILQNSEAEQGMDTEQGGDRGEPFDWRTYEADERRVAHEPVPA